MSVTSRGLQEHTVVVNLRFTILCSGNWLLILGLLLTRVIRPSFFLPQHPYKFTDSLFPSATADGNTRYLFSHGYSRHIQRQFYSVKDRLG